MQFPEFAGLPLLITALVLFVLYRRIRRNIGRQRVSGGMFVRVAVFGVLGLILLVLPSQSKAIQLMALAVGTTLGLLGLRLATFEYEEGGTFYTPNPYIGMTVIALFIARIGYRALTMRGRSEDLATNGPFGTDPGMSVTLTLLIGIIGYYLCFYVGVLIRRQRNQAVGVVEG